MFSVALPLFSIRFTWCAKVIRQSLLNRILRSQKSSSHNIRTWQASANISQDSVNQDFQDEIGDRARGGLPRIFVDDLPSFQGALHTLQGPELVHAVKVLRLGPDSRLELFDGNGGLVTATVVHVSKTSCQLAALHSPWRLQPSGAQWTVAAACGSLKGGRADWLVEKCTELGAAELIPLLTQRSPRASEGRTDRWERVGRAAAKQCEGKGAFLGQRLHNMRVREPMTLQEFCQQSMAPPCTFLAAAHSPPLVDALASREKAVARGGMLVVGPEGDFSEEEMKQLLALGAISVGLGPRRLRVETAAVAMLATVMLLGDRSREQPTSSV